MPQTEDRESHLHWVGDAALPGQVGDVLMGPGAPFEMVRELVLGAEHLVFAKRPATLRAMFDATAADLQDLIFLISPQRQWSYREALDDVDAVSALLHRRYGIRPGDRVALVAANQAEYAIVMWAVISLGAIVTSLNGWWTTPELEYGIELTKPSLVAGDERRLARLAVGSVPDGVPVVQFDALLDQAREHRDERPPRPDLMEDAPAVILFTSGTTGRPKGAVLSHRNIISFAMVNRLNAAIAAAAAGAVGGPGTTSGPATQGCLIVSSPMFHISGLVAVLVTGAAFPVKLVFPPLGPWDPEVWLRLTQAHRVTTWAGVPTQYWRLLRHPDLESFDISSVTIVGAGGAVFPPELVRELHARFPSVRLGNGYGMSETVGLGTLTGGELFLSVPDSVGVAQPTVEVEVRGEDGRRLPEGEIGEIHLRTPSVFLGYWDNPAATQASLDKDRWYRTGDFGRISGGLLFLESRRRDLILRGGENVYPIEIENRLVEHPDIDDAAVIGVEHAELGQVPKAFVVCRDGTELSEFQVKEWCAAALAAFKIPATVEFRKGLPYTDTGKLRKTDLEEEERVRAANA